LGLVDHLGNFHQAVADAAQKAGLAADYQLVWLEKELSFVERVLADSMAQVAQLLEPQQLSAQAQIQQLFAPVMADMQLLLNRRPGEVVKMAHCLCQAPQL